ncbi:MAG: carcinine hydrolase/isopenicillin-N N-acyltransferase family protein [Ignavibacteriae bacterium]|nr:carcinine hydrolase/isopenicillin-N N-acyltransferase family protein [Ignavibacteriota bacterium]
MIKYFFCLLLFIFLIPLKIIPCTTAIISGKITPDGRPLLWKNRDTDDLYNNLIYINGSKYSYIAIVNSNDKNPGQVWIGMNNAGFSIMNSVSYNLEPGDTTKLKDREGVIMRLALETCENVDDFEKLLKTYKKPLGVQTNFGVIDAFGNGAYFETSNYFYKKYDLNDGTVAPDGYLLRTNFSVCGIPDEGSGYERFDIESELFKSAYKNKNLTPKFIVQDAARCLKHSITKVDLKNEYSDNPSEKKYVDFNDFIPRYSTSASVVIQGVKKGESPELSTMWNVLGFPLCSVVYPVWFNSENNLPDILKAGTDGNSELCKLSLKLKNKCFSLKKGKKQNYLNINALYNGEGTGIMQKLRPIEDYVFLSTEDILIKFREGSFTANDIKLYYNHIDSIIISKLKSIID